VFPLRKKRTHPWGEHRATTIVRKQPHTPPRPNQPALRLASSYYPVAVTQSVLFPTSPDHPPDLVRAQHHWFDDFGTKSRGEGGGHPPPRPFTSTLQPNTSNLAAVPLPLSAVFMDNRQGCAWPDRTSFRKKIQEGQQGPQALCRGVSGGRAYQSSLSKTSCLPAAVAGHDRRINNARNHYLAMSDLQEQELLNYEEQEDDHGSA
jgi:hypothetical protein